MKATGETLRSQIAELMPRAKADLAELVAFRSVADPQQQPPTECSGAADWIGAAFAAAGLEEMTRSTTSDGSDCVHGHTPHRPGAPTVLLYSHYDVQPPLGEDAWNSPPWTLTERSNGRWYGRGAADCKGNVIAHLTALRALRSLEEPLPLNVKVIFEGSEEQGTGGLDAFVPLNAELLRADTICVVDTGNTEAGHPTLCTSLRGETTVDLTLDALNGPMHSGAFGGPAPDPVAALIQVLASLHDANGNTTVDELDNSGIWAGANYGADQFRQDARVLEGVDLVGNGAVADMLWARFNATTVGIDIPPVDGSVLAIQASARARVSLRVPPGVRSDHAQDALVAHLRSRVPWGLRCSIERIASGDPFAGSLSGPGFEALKGGLEESYGRKIATAGLGGSIPLCNVLRETYPDAEILLYGVEEPACLIHAPNESVDPSEIEHLAFAEALFLQKLA